MGKYSERSSSECFFMSVRGVLVRMCPRVASLLYTSIASKASSHVRIGRGVVSTLQTACTMFVQLCCHLEIPLRSDVG